MRRPVALADLSLSLSVSDSDTGKDRDNESSLKPRSMSTGESALAFSDSQSKIHQSPGFSFRRLRLVLLQKCRHVLSVIRRKHQQAPTSMRVIFYLLVITLLLVLSQIAWQHHRTWQQGRFFYSQARPLWEGEELRSYRSLHQTKDGSFPSYTRTDGNPENTTTSTTMHPSQLHIELVLAYCQTDLSWMQHDIFEPLLQLSHNIRITVISKCNNHKVVWVNHTAMAKLALFPFVKEMRKVRMEKFYVLPNVGGCDYAYAHFLDNYVLPDENDITVDNTIVLFLKDTPRDNSLLNFGCHGRYRTIAELIYLASGGRTTKPASLAMSVTPPERQVTAHGEFACGMKLSCQCSAYHDTRVLGKFVIEQYMRRSDRKKLNISQGQAINLELDQPGFNPNGYKNLADFHRRALRHVMPDVTQVCYGGSFAVPKSRIVEVLTNNHTRQVLSRLTKSLARNTTVAVEEHYAERSWAGLLADPPSVDEIKILKGVGRYGTYNLKGGVWGALKADKRDICID